MKIKHVSGIIILFLIIITLSTCSYDNDITKVTIYFGKESQAALKQEKLPLIDRFLRLFSSEVYAQHHDPANTDYYFLWVTADDMDPVILYDIPGTESPIAVDVPSGSNRVFTLLSLHGEYYNYIGQHVADLDGTDTSISIDMYPCLNEIIVTPISYSMEISWIYDSTLITPEGFSTLKIYRTCYGDDPMCEYTGAVEEIEPAWNIDTGYYYDNDVEAITSPNPQVFYYFLSVNSPYSPGGGMSAPANFVDYFSDYYFVAFYMMGSAEYPYAVK